MIERTDEEIKKFSLELFKNDSFEETEVEVSRVNDEVKVRVWAMYYAPGLSFEKLMKLADFMGTKNINDDDRFSHGGCETCDYGSEYGFTLTVRP